MNRVIVILLVVFLPGAALAQEPTVRPTEGIFDVRPAVFRSTDAETVQAPQTAARPEPGPRRRPSMVGYIGDSTIASQVRVRFDAGWSVDTPDRAEFFYAKCGCFRGLPISNAAYDPNAPGPGSWATDLNFQQLYVLGEYAALRRVSFFAEVPVRFLQPETVADAGTFPSASGLSDMRIGGKVGLVSTPTRQLTASVQFIAPTGDSLKGLGTAHWSLEPALLYHESPTDRLAIEAQFGDVIPDGGSAGIPTNGSDKFAGSVLYYGVGPSFQVYRSRQLTIAPVVELVGWHVLSGFQTAAVSDASGINIVNLKFGTRVLLEGGSSIYAGWGHAVTTESWYDNLFRVEYRMAF